MPFTVISQYVRESGKESSQSIRNSLVESGNWQPSAPQHTPGLSKMNDPTQAPLSFFIETSPTAEMGEGGKCKKEYSTKALSHDLNPTLFEILESNCTGVN